MECSLLHAEHVNSKSKVVLFSNVTFVLPSTPSPYRFASPLVRLIDGQYLLVTLPDDVLNRIIKYINGLAGPGVSTLGSISVAGGS